MCYATFAWSRSYRFQVFLAIGLLGLSIFITLYYHYLQDPVFHQNAYAILTAVVLLRAMWMMETRLRPSQQDRTHPFTYAKAKQQDNIVNTMWVMVAVG
jgi:dihydroceramidase